MDEFPISEVEKLLPGSYPGDYPGEYPGPSLDLTASFQPRTTSLSVENPLGILDSKTAAYVSGVVQTCRRHVNIM